MKKLNHKKKILPLFITLVMLLSLFPMSAFADEMESGSISQTEPTSMAQLESTSSVPESVALSPSEPEEPSESSEPEEPAEEVTSTTLEGVEVLVEGGGNPRARISAQASGHLTLHRAEYIHWNFNKTGGGVDERPWYLVDIDGKVAYCVEPENPATVSGSYGTIDYANLSTDQRYAIGYAMKYGAQNINDPLYHMATQVVIWEIVYGYLDLNTLQPTGSILYGNTIGYNDYNRQADVNYRQILNDMRNHKQVPSFMGSVESTMPTHTVPGAPGSFEVTLANTNAGANLADFSFANLDGVTFTKSGQNLTIRSAQSLDGKPFAAYKGAAGYTDPLIYWGSGSNQIRATAGTIDPVPAYFKLTTKETVKYHLTLTKLQAGTDKPLAGAVFEVKHANGVVGSYTTPASGTLEIEVPWPGEYTITETKAPSGHKLDGTNPRTISLSTTSPNGTVTFRNNALAALELLKLDTQTDKPIEGVQFSLSLGSKEIGKYTTGKDGKINVSGLDAGEYTIVEVKPASGYLPDTTPKTVSLEWGKTATITIKNIRLASLHLRKIDAETGLPLSGISFEIYDAKDKLLGEYTSDSNGLITLNHTFMPGTYKIKETKTIPGYVLDETVRSVKLEAGATASITWENAPIRGGVRVEKWDNELEKNEAQGGATLAGATFDIINRNSYPVNVGGVSYASGKVVHTITTDAVGAAETAANLLPYGSYEVIEKTPPTGYRLAGTLKQTFRITTNGIIVNLNTSETAIQNNPIRGDIEGVKISESMAHLANVPFKITSKTTGESHIVVTDENGYFSTSSSWNLHSANTNKGETEFDGVWFGDIATLDDSLGALLHDTYIITEMPCASNALYTLTPPFEVKVTRHNTVVQLGTITNFYDAPPEIRTTALDKQSGTHSAVVGTCTTIVDTVEYAGLKAGITYTMTGILMDKATGKPLLVEGKEVTGSTEFVAQTSDGTVQVEFTFNTIGLQGRSVVVFETLYYGDTRLITHADIEDEGQTVHLVPPEIGTTAVDKATGTHIGQASEATTIIDTVRYAGMEAGEEYTVTGILMDKGTGAPLLVDGKKVTGSTTFTPETGSGSIEVSFTFNSLALQGTSVVVFETLYIGGVELALHADLADEGQTVTFGGKPAEVKSAGSPRIGSSPQTGDSNMLVLSAILCAMGGLAGAVLLILHRRRQNAE
ncbi:VaFE repeat-containing surface-anchored protein [Ruminococcaceae bacterium OttesenSCG-928-A16]|nr:VaFE repeat-containing surface-anchored protein [Ruminococcaceae bacterium OttesenSCG-928-A16]